VNNPVHGHRVESGAPLDQIAALQLRLLFAVLVTNNHVHNHFNHSNIDGMIYIDERPIL
jgi:hypothetical protein